MRWAPGLGRTFGRRSGRRGGRRAGGLLLCCLLLFSLPGCERSPLGDDLSEARSAVAAHEWTRAERLLERFLRESGDADKRWEAWQLLLTVANATGVTLALAAGWLAARLRSRRRKDGE